VQAQTRSGLPLPARLMRTDQESRGLRLSFRSGLPFGVFGSALFVTTLLVITSEAGAADFDGLFAGTNDFGNVGLMQTPTARMRPEGDFGLGVSTVRPYNQIHFFLQPLPWLETAVRYTDVTNRFYSNDPLVSDPSFSGDQHYKDKSADVKVGLLSEGHYWPSVAIGVQDIGGTGLFSSEYLVSSYHWYDLDFSFGLAWGRLGAGGNIYNPFRVISGHFGENRYGTTDTTSGTAGGTGINRLFTGQTIGPFGGAEWITPIKGLALRVEYDGNNYQHEAFSNNLRQDSRFNVGLAYRGLSGVDMGVGLERGNTVMARFAIYTNFQQLRGVAKTSDPQPIALPPAQALAAADHPVADSAVASSNNSANASAPSAAAPLAANASAPIVGTVAAQASEAAGLPAAPVVSSQEQHEFVLKLREALKQQGFTLIAVDYNAYLKEVCVWLGQDRYRNPARAVGRATRALAATAPAEISKFTLAFVDQGVENYRAAVYRQDFEKAARENDLDAALSSIVLKGPGDGVAGAEYIDNTWLPKLSWDTGPAVRQSVGGPNTFYAGQLYWKLAGAVALTEHINISGAAGFNIINNFNQITLQSNSVLPHVRSDIVQYLQQGSNGLINLESDYTWSPYPDWYHRVSLGIFEEMYGGVATELLYRPYGRSWAVAFDINRVKQRGFDEMFDFLPYTVTTGHATLYYKPGFYNLLFKVSAGQYLARDRGGTVDISREFDSGVRIGVFATKTNVSAAEFGEGSFDKGVYITLPLDLFFAQSTRREAGFVFRPLTRDGGQMVYDGPELYSTVTDGQPSDFARGGSELFK